ncbi:MAG: DMT family transporter [Stappiaceae bacterium]
MNKALNSENQAAKAILLMAVGMLFIPLGDSFAKMASNDTTYSAATLAWARFALGTIIALPLALLFGHLRGLTKRFWGTQLIRAVFLCATIVQIITAVSLISFADAYGAFFVGPTVTTLLARFVLKEQVRLIEWCAVAAGFVGVLLIVKPGIDMSAGLIWALSAGFTYAAFLTATRWGRAVGPPLAQLAGQLLIGTFLLLPFAIGNISPGALQSPGLLLGSGLSSALGNLLAIMALGFARAAILTPLVYVQLIGATLLGWFLFGTMPDVISALGLAILVSTGILPFIVSTASETRPIRKK